MYMHKLSASQLNRPTPEEFIRMPRRPLYVILDNVRSLNNIGSVSYMRRFCRRKTFPVRDNGLPAAPRYTAHGFGGHGNGGMGIF